MKKIISTSAIFFTSCLLALLGGISSPLARLAGAAFAQDIHFSQSNMTPLLINPALTGIFEGNQRAFLNYKNQWQGMGASGAVFNTGLFSFDTHLFEKKLNKKGFLGAGLNAFKDVAGDLKLGTTQLNVSFSGTVFINSNQLISGGLQGGFVQKSISTEAMQWENQYDATTGGYNSGLLSNDIASIPPVTYGDFSSGLLWLYNKSHTTLSANDQLRLVFGVAAFNLNTPKQSFYTQQATGKLYAKFVVHSSARIGIKNTNLILVPNVVFFQQGPSYELNAGMLCRLAIKDKSIYTGYGKEMAFSIGAQYRLNDALIPTMLMEYSDFAIGLCYDVNTSSLKVGTQGRGGVEISLRYIRPIGISPTRLID